LAFADCRYVADVTISRCNCFMLQPRSMNSTASQSSSSGCEGGSLCVPRSSLVTTSPVPKYACQARLTSARAVVGDFSSTSHFANVNRVGGASGGSGCSTSGTPGVTDLSGLRKSPRLRMCVSRGDCRGRSTSCDEPSGCCFQSASTRSLAAFHSDTVVRQ